MTAVSPTRPPCWSGVPVILDPEDIRTVRDTVPGYPMTPTAAFDLAHQLDAYGFAAVAGQYLSTALAAAAQGDDVMVVASVRLAAEAIRAQLSIPTGLTRG